MIFALISLHQGLAIGAVGLLFCAFSDVRPAVQAVQSRFEKLQGVGAKSIKKEEDELDQLVDSESDLEIQQTSKDEGSFYSDTKTESTKSGPPLSIKSAKKAAVYGMMETTVYDIESDYDSGSESTSTPSLGSEISSDGSNDTSPRQLAKPTMSPTKALKNRFELVAQRAKASYNPSWSVDSNVAINFAVLIIGIMHLVWLTISAPIVQRRNNRTRAILPTENNEERT